MTPDPQSRTKAQQNWGGNPAPVDRPYTLRALSQQLAQMPNVLFVYSGSTYPSITSAYSACASAQTCEIWDYGLQTGQSLTSSPWNFDTNELPVHLRLGPGVLTMSGPLIVPRNSTIEGAGRAVGSGAGGTVIQASSGILHSVALATLPLIPPPGVQQGRGCSPSHRRSAGQVLPRTGQWPHWAPALSIPRKIHRFRSRDRNGAHSAGVGEGLGERRGAGERFQRRGEFGRSSVDEYDDLSS